jgi:hypothetical protein
MTWENETRTTIDFISPEGNVYSALWRNGERSLDKKLGIFNIPNFKGDIVQDLNVNSVLYPLVFYFDGPNHNRESESFFKACSETGQWQITHPVKGTLALQLVNVREMMRPVDDGNYTQFDTNWIEPANVQILISSDQTIAAIIADVLNTIEDGVVALQQLRADAYSAINAASNTFNKIAGAMDTFIEGITQTDAVLQDAYLGFRQQFNAALAAYGINDTDTRDVAESLQGMALTPSEATTDYSTRFSIYEDLQNEIITFTPDNTTIDDFNKVTAQEYGVTLILTIFAQIIATTEFTSRSEIITAIENIFSIFNDSIETLEEIQSNFSDLDIEFQYYSQTGVYTSLINLYTLCYTYLINQFYNLNVEKRFTLKKPRSPLEITVTEYGELGESDSNYDLFLESNELSGNDILILPAGREVVVYG